MTHQQGYLRGPVTFDHRSFYIDGRPVWLHSAEIHYFRHPHQLWEETLLRAARAGYNTVSTYVPWNWHEAEEGVYRFDGDRDLMRYLDIAADLGLYTIVRPGPYICSEWDGGGFPGWLYTKPGLVFRDDNAAFLDPVRRWFAELLPHVAERQVSRNGSVVLVQNDNEYGGGWNDSTRRYVQAISDSIRAAGIEVPIISCTAHAASATEVMINYSTDPADQILSPEMIVCFNSFGSPEPVRHLRERQPYAPVFLTEFWAGAQAFWGQPVGDWPQSLDQARALFAFLAYGAQLNTYMMDGGTNFGFMAGANIATSYETRYEVREGGLLSEKYYAMKPGGLFANQFGELLATGEMVGEPEALPGTAARVIRRHAAQGDLLFIIAEGRLPEVTLRLPDGPALTVAMPDCGAAVLPHRLQVLPGVTLDYASLSLLGRDAARRLVVLHGVAGARGVASVNGQEVSLTVERGAVARIVVGDITVLVVDHLLAQRAWFVDDEIFFGPDYVGGREAGGYPIRHSAETPPCWRVTMSGEVERLALGEVLPYPSLPSLGDWRIAVAPEPAGGGSGWQPLDAPRSHERLGAYYGYVWYRAEVDAAEDGVARLFFADANSRVLVYANGEYCGSTFSSAGQGCYFIRSGVHHPIDELNRAVDAPLRQGANTLVFLSDNMGRTFDGVYDEELGIRGPVYAGAYRVPLHDWRALGPQPVSDEAFAAVYAKEYRTPAPLPTFTFTLDIPQDTCAYLRMPAWVNNAAVTVDGRFLGGLWRTRYPWATFALPADCAGRRVAVQVQYRPESPDGSLEKPVVFFAPQQGLLTRWAWKPFDDVAAMSSDELTGIAMPAAGDGGEEPILLVPDRRAGETDDRTGAPTLFRCTFPLPPGDAPVFLHPGACWKGQIYLNGHNVGRVWQLGKTQQRYYLPRPWMREENELILLEEMGVSPKGAVLLWGPPHPWATTLAPPHVAISPQV